MSEIVDAANLPIRGNHGSFTEEIEKLKIGKAIIFTLDEKNLKTKAVLFSVVGNLRKSRKLNVMARSLGDGKFAVIKDKSRNGVVASEPKKTNDSVE